MELVSRNRATYRVSTVRVEQTTEEEQKLTGYRFRAIFDEDPFTITRCNEVEHHESPDGQVYIKVITESGGVGHKTKTTLTIWS